MTTTPPTPDEREEHLRATPLARALEDEVAEARAIEPLVAQARVVQLSVRERVMRALPLVFLAAIGIAFIASGLYKELSLDALARHHGTMTSWVDHHPVLFATGFTIALALVISTGMPGGAVMVVGAGLLFGMWWAALFAVIGDTLGAMALYFAARRFFIVDGAKPPALVEKIRDGFATNPTSFAFFIRLVPVFPFGAASVALAWLGCRFPLFLTATALGVFPSSLVYAALGQGLGKTIDAKAPISLDLLAQPRFLVPLAALAVLALVPALFGLRRRPPATKA